MTKDQEAAVVRRAIGSGITACVHLAPNAASSVLRIVFRATLLLVGSGPGVAGAQEIRQTIQVSAWSPEHSQDGYTAYSSQPGEPGPGSIAPLYATSAFVPRIAVQEAVPPPARRGFAFSVAAGTGSVNLSPWSVDLQLFFGGNVAAPTDTARYDLGYRFHGTLERAGVIHRHLFSFAFRSKWFIGSTGLGLGGIKIPDLPTIPTFSMNVVPGVAFGTSGFGIVFPIKADWVIGQRFSSKTLGISLQYWL